MSNAHAVFNVGAALQILKEQIDPSKWSETPLPIIAAPHWWLEELRIELGADEGMEPDTIHNCTVVRRDELEEPMLVDHDGKMYPVLPKWQRKQQTEGDSNEQSNSDA